MVCVRQTSDAETLMLSRMKGANSLSPVLKGGQQISMENVLFIVGSAVAYGITSEQWCSNLLQVDGYL